VLVERRTRLAGAFGGAAAVYAASRPSYPAEAVRWATGAGRRVLDLGAGTGKLTAALLALGCSPVAIEPDAAMRAELRRALPGVDLRAGSAENIPFHGSWADAVLVGQAFHWFDPERALPEIARVLVPGGTLGLLWNLIEPSSAWVEELVALLRGPKGSGSWVSRGGGPWVTLASLSARLIGRPVVRTWRFTQTLDEAGLVDLVASRSYVITLADDERELLLDRVRELARTQPEMAGRTRFELPYRCEVWRASRSRTRGTAGMAAPLSTTR
jgi:SAM-dependent methyltransferase